MEAVRIILIVLVIFFCFLCQVNNHIMEFYLLEFDVPLGNDQI